MADDMYDINKYTDKQLYDILDMNSPTDRELEAKIIHLINKYDNMQNESGYKLSTFFQNIYDHFFNNDNIEEGFTNKQSNFNENQTSQIFATNNGNMNVTDPNQPILNTPTQKQIGYEPQQISSVQQFDYSPDKMQLNPLLKQTIKRIISIDSQYRDKTTNPMTTNFAFDLSEPLRDVVSLKLYSVQIPYTWYTIPKSYGSNFFYLKGNAAGINNGKYDYKIGIPSGNYTPAELETTINNRFNDIAAHPPGQLIYTDIPNVISASDINFNGKQLVNYDSKTSKMTFDMNLQKIYTEAYYQLYFPQWTSPITDSSNSIPGYLGFNYNTYDACSITSNQTYITTLTIATETTADYYLDASNNYFTINVYSNDSNKYNFSYSQSVQPIHTITVTLKDTIDNTQILVDQQITRSQLVTVVNNALKTNQYLDPASNIQLVDISANKANSGYSYYKMSIILDRYNVKYNQNCKIAVLFPNEHINTVATGRSTIWTRQPDTNHCCFFFDNSVNEVAQFISESSAVFSSYKVDSSTNILFTCNTPGYSGGANDFSLNIPSNITPGYNLNSFLNVITNSFITYTGSAVTFNMNSGPGEIQKGASIDTNSKFNLAVDLTKTFDTQYYDISFDTTSILGRMGNYNVGQNPWTENSHLVTKSIFTHSIKSSNVGYYVDARYIFTISPNTTISNPGNKNASPVDVYLLPEYTIPITFDYVEDYIYAINKSIQQTVVSLLSINDSQAVLSRSTFTSTYNAQTTNYDLSLNIIYSYSLTEANYDISFNDNGYEITSTNNAWHYFDINSNYNLYSQNVGSYAQIIGKTPIYGDSIKITSSTNKMIFQTNYISQYNIPNDIITIEIDPDTYTINTLYNKIQSLFDATPKLYGSSITSVEKNNKIYTKIKLNINNIYTTKDYNLVFYDPISFVQCYAGSRSVQNTTWDSTIGWILGFRDYMQYTLVSSNLITDSNDTSKTYYLTSQEGKYTYASTKDTNSKLTTNVAITLTGDTTVSTNLYNYFLISLDDYIQNHLNDGLVTITRKETAIQKPDYSYATTQICDPATKTLVSNSSQQQNSDNVTNNQLYSLNQSIYSQQNSLKTYSPGPFIKDLFGIIPIKPPSKNGDYYIEFGGSLQNQERLYFGPVNIRKMSVQLLNDRGDIIDLNNSNWSFSFICEQLYNNSQK